MAVGLQPQACLRQRSGQSHAPVGEPEFGVQVLVAAPTGHRLHNIDVQGDVIRRKGCGSCLPIARRAEEDALNRIAAHASQDVDAVDPRMECLWMGGSECCRPPRIRNSHHTQTC